MGIMNKMKTVRLRDMTWTMSVSSGRYIFGCTPPGGKISDNPNSPIRAVCDGYVAVTTNKTWVDKDMAYSLSSGSSVIAFINNSFTNVSAFLASEGDKILTYETIESVEEEIISYHPQQLLEEGILSDAGYTSSISFQDNVYTCKTAISTENNGAWRIQALTFQFKGGHKYLISALYRCEEKTLMAFSYSEGVSASIENPVIYGSDYARASSICTYSNDRTGRVYFYFDRSSELDPANEHTVYVKNPIVVDLTELYGAGNEPTSVETFLSQHPEYRSYVQFYDGPVSVAEEIIEKEALKPVMADNEWSDIFDAFKNDSAPDTWQVGDTKPLTLLDGTTYTIRLCDKQAGRYQYSDGSGSSKAVFEFVELVKLGSTTRFQINQTGTNVGGWASSYLRGTIIPNFETFVPDDILAAISRVNVLSGTGDGTTTGTSSSTNKLFLPAETEMFSSRTYSIGNEESQLGQFDYYNAHNTNADRIKRDAGTATAYSYWLRSPISGYAKIFCLISFNGAADYSDAHNSYALALIFAI